MKAPLLLHLFCQVFLLFDALGWEVKMPKEIHGLRGSCLVIPCTFNYTSNPPKNPRRVVWYQWASRGYPKVYDHLHTDDVIEKFRGKTDLYGNSSGDCSLLIKNLEESHHEEKLYTWIDPENVGWRTYAFYDVTSTILVDARPQSPSINIFQYSGGERITVTCSTSHTCPYSKPNITLNGIEGSDQIDNELIKDGLWKITLTRTGVVKTENSINCSVTYYGGITVTDTKNRNVSDFYHDQDPLRFGPKTVGVYIVTPLLAILFACIIAGFIIYKKQHRQTQHVKKGSLSEQRHFNKYEVAWNKRKNSSDVSANICTVSENKSSSPPCTPAPKSEPDSFSGYECADENTNMDELMYENTFYENIG